MKKRRDLNVRQAKLLHERAKGKTLAQAAIAAGYSPKNANQSGYQALNVMKGRIQNLMEETGLDERSLIHKYLLPLMEAKETLYFQKAGKVTDKREVKALNIRLNALKEAFALHGSYAPRDPKEAAQYGVKIIIADIPGPPGEFNQFIDIVPPKHPKNYGSFTGNGNKPKE
jgi:phage terminase small subunit